MSTTPSAVAHNIAGRAADKAFNEEYVRMRKFMDTGGPFALKVDMQVSTRAAAVTTLHGMACTIAKYIACGYKSDAGQWSFAAIPATKPKRKGGRS